jgi:hypothetical protein
LRDITLIVETFDRSVLKVIERDLARSALADDGVKRLMTM